MRECLGNFCRFPKHCFGAENEIYALVIKGTVDIQGLVALQGKKIMGLSM